MVITSHTVAQYFSCERKAYFLGTDGAHSVIMASALREYIRTIDKFSTHSLMKKAHIVSSNPRLPVAAQETKNIFLQDEYRTKTIVNAVFSFDNSLYAFVPACTWHKKMEGWVLHFCTVSSGLRAEHRDHVACALHQCEKMNIPVAKIRMHFLSSVDNTRDAFDSEVYWVESDITNQINKNVETIKKKIDGFLEFVQSPKSQDKENWGECDKQYCDVCSVEKSYDVNDVKTLRKAKPLITDLLAKGITNIQDIPSDIELSQTTARQVEAVKQNTQLFFEDEVKVFLDRLEYPRYYLDFEAFSTIVPIMPHSKLKGFVPFLFSLQWQDHPNDKIHTKLWAMPYGSDKRLEMWQELSSSLANAGCVVVYSSSFEQEMILQLSHLAQEKQKGHEMINKIVDLQKIFIDLSVYKPSQKGKISLKTITALWLDGDYKRLTVSEGIVANYFYTIKIDEKRAAFEKIKKESAYIHDLYEKVRRFDSKFSIALEDIAFYCKYDTQVMIQIVALLEKTIANNIVDN